MYYLLLTENRTDESFHCFLTDNQGCLIKVVELILNMGN